MRTTPANVLIKSTGAWQRFVLIATLDSCQPVKAEPVALPSFPSPLGPARSRFAMSSDLSTGRTPAASSHTKGGLSVHMAPAAAMFGTQVSPEEYRKRKVALLTGQFVRQLADSLPLAPPATNPIVPLLIETGERG